MNLLARTIGKVRLRSSHWLVPRDRMRIKHVQAGQFGLLVRVNEDVGRLIWLNAFEKPESTFFAAAVRPDDVCLDIGGNIGYFAMLLASRATAGHVHIFEPIPLNAALIRTNLLLNGFDNGTVNQMALSASDGEVQFSVSRDSAYSSMRSTGTSAEVRRITVATTTLDAYLAGRGIGRVDVVKVDVEGAEDLVLRGGEGLFANAACRPRLVMLELFAPNLAPYRVTVAEVVARMTGWGYAPHVVTDGGHGLRGYDPKLDGGKYNFFFVPA